MLFAFASCNSEPKEISSETGNIEATGVFSNHTNSKPEKVQKESHRVVVAEIMKTSNYVYMRVKESGEEFWLATGLQDIEVGATYMYDDGLLQTNFVSKEFNRTFDKIYLVTNIKLASGVQGKEKSSGENIKSIIVTIKELVENPKKFDGKIVQITAKCTKLNKQILGKNWMHLQDGSKDDFDLVITSDVAVAEGKEVTMKGTVVLDKNFGAGYRYDIILENGLVVNE